MLTIPSKSTPSDATSLFIRNLCFAPLHRKEEITVIGIDAMLHFSPKKDRDGLVVDVDDFTFFCHLIPIIRREPIGSLLLAILLIYGVTFVMRPSIVGYTAGSIDVLPGGVP